MSFLRVLAWPAMVAFALALSLADPAGAQTSPAIQLALSRALGKDAAGCSATELRAIVQKADVKTLGAIGNSRVILAGAGGTCICGNVNCPYVVLRLDGAPNNVLLDTYAYAVDPLGKDRPLPELREVSHDSALVSVTTTDAYRNGKYVAIDTQRVRADTGESKPDRIPLRFAPGTSSALVRGRISEGWYDEYTFAATPGQRITVSGPAALTYTLSPESSDHSIDLLPNVAVAIPKGGRYHLLIDGADQTEQPYLATITIH
jgi:hypothetical protein